MIRALITGSNGFIGTHLAQYLIGYGWDVFGFDKQEMRDRQNIFIGDLTEFGSTHYALKESRPDVVFHLAGAIKAREIKTLYDSNLLGTISLLDSLMELKQRPIVIVASSSAVYGSGFGGRLINEKFKPRPVTQYGVSKLAQEVASLRYFDAFQLPVVIVRMFNLLGPGQSPDLAGSAFARQIALAEVKGGDEMVTGNLSTRRDFVDVRDAARAFACVAEKGKPGQVYNVCSGHAVLMRKVLDEMLSMSTRQLKVQVEAGRLQKNDIPVQVGDAQKLNRISGWRPRIRLKQSLSDLLNDWRLRIQSEME